MVVTITKPATLLLNASYDDSFNNCGHPFGYIKRDGVVTHTIWWGQILETGCLLVESDSKLFWQLDNYKVSSQASGKLWLCPTCLFVGVPHLLGE